MPVILETRDLRKSFDDVRAVDGLSFSVEEGEIFGFLGPNGAGKTTTISILCGLLRPDSGSVLFRGRDVTADGKEFRHRVGLCPQALTLWERLTVRENLEFLGSLYGMKRRELRARADLLLEEFNLQEKAKRLAKTLSGGMQRRLNVALALIHDPELVILDEPEAGLDPQSRAMMREHLRALARRKTLIVTTHNMDEAERVADRVAVIDAGRLLVLDTPTALRERYGADGKPAADLEAVFLQLTGRRLRE